MCACTGWSRYILLLGLAGLFGCAEPHLVPASSAGGSARADDASVVAREGGVAVTATLHAWPGAPVVENHVDAIRVDIENRSKKDLYVAREDITLVGSNVLTAIPPGSVDVRELTTTTGVLDSADRDTGTAAETFRDEQSSAVEAEVQDYALHEGALPAGHRIAGFVYFERQPQKVGGVDLRVVFRQSKDGPIAMTVVLPFRIER